MNLRPHHLLCIQKFTGHGYNSGFTAHMESVVSELSENPQTQITVSQGCDELCKMCPNNISGVCASLEKVSLMDSAVLGICDLAYGENVPWAKIAKKARKPICSKVRKVHGMRTCSKVRKCRENDYE